MFKKSATTLILMLCVSLFAVVLYAASRPGPAKVKPGEPTVGTQLPAPAPAPAVSLSDPEDATVAAAKAAYERWLATGEASAWEKELMDDYVWAGRETGGDPLDNVGGPDGWGYRYVDNVAPDTATYNWIELRGDANATWINTWTGSHDDGVSALLPLGFDFPFYGSLYDSFRVATNGLIEFLTDVRPFSNNCLPSTAVAGPAIFPYWDDLHLDYGGIAGGADVIGYRNFGNYTVIEFDSVGHCCSNGNASLKFQAILYSNGKIKLQYNTLVMAAAYDSTQTIGIQSAGSGGSAALQYVCNLSGLQPASGRAIWFYPPLPTTHNFGCAGVDSPTGGARYEPGSQITVTFDANNRGTTTEAATVRYRFNNGVTRTETTAALPPYGVETHTFATPITAPTTPGDYQLLVWTDLTTDTDRSDDTCRVTVRVATCVDLELTAPGSISGNTVGAGDDCNLRSGLDQVVRVTIPTTGSWTFSLCGGDPSWDTYMYLTSACCGGTLATDDDGCSSPNSLASVIACQALTAGTYYVDIEPYGSSSGTWTLTVSPCVPCEVTQQAGDVVEVAENPADTTFYRTDPDGGCNSIPPQFRTIACGGTIFGRAFTYTTNGTNYRDTDWYTISVSEPESLVVTATAEFPMLFGIIRYGSAAPCDTAATFVVSRSVTDTCLTQTISTDCRVPGLYAVFVAPTGTTGIPTPREYRVTLNCFPCTPPQPPANDDCATAEPIAVAANDSVTVTGSTQLANVTCSDTCDFDSNSRDVFYSITLNGCRKIEMSLAGTPTSGDMHLSVYAPGECCPAPAMLCNDDWDNFAPMPEWAVHLPGYGTAAFVADSMGPGTYVIRVGRYSTGSGPYILKVYDNGACSGTAPCDPPTSVTLNRVAPARPDSTMELRFDAPVAGSYQIWSTLDKVAPFQPAYPWVLETTVTAPAGSYDWRDPAVLATYKRYAVIQVCN